MSCIAPVFLVQSYRTFHPVFHQFFQQRFEVIHVCYRRRIPVFSQRIFDGCLVVDHTSALDTEREAVQVSVGTGDTVLCTTVCCPGFVAQVNTFFFTDGSNVLRVSHDQCRSIFCCVSCGDFLRRCTTADGVNFQFCSCFFAPFFSGSFQLRFNLALCVQHCNRYITEISTCAVCAFCCFLILCTVCRGIFCCIFTLCIFIGGIGIILSTCGHSGYHTHSDKYCK